MFMNYISIALIIRHISSWKTYFTLQYIVLVYNNFNPANEVNFSICEHKIILKPVYTIPDIQLFFQFQILIFVDP